MAKKEKKRIGVAGALMWRITALTLALWLAAMGTITWMGACAARDQFYDEFQEATLRLPNYVEDSFNDFAFDVLHYYESIESTYWELPIKVTDSLGEDYFGYSMIVREYADDWDEDSEDPYPGPVILDDGNFLYSYCPWSTEDGDSSDYLIIDLDKTAFGRALVQTDIMTDRYDRYFDTSVQSVTGYFEEGRFHLVSLEYDPRSSVPDEIEAIPIEDAVPEGKELVTLAASNWLRKHLAYEEPVTVDGVTYGSLEEILLSGDHPYAHSLLESVYTSGEDVYDQNGEYVGWVKIAMHSRPLAYTLAQILHLYQYTLLLLVVVLLLIWQKIRRELVKPMQELIRKAEEDVSPLFPPEPSQWQEVWKLQDVYTQQMQELKKENTQLRTALDYAKDAESNRRKLISGISHELKTPLAIIHSYAEGLDEGIAAEKQSQYLDVILEETENMDALVLQMLDHSRLEAGRVKLQSDRFSLAQLTRQILEVLAPLAEDRGLTLEKQTMEDFQIIADEARISQVIRNLVSNAVKYTRPQGKIWVNVYRYQDKTHFTIENQCHPLPQETLEKLWDSYYRSAGSQKAKGTGLGLPIVKAIVDLHGGTCTADNTSEGVKFRITLP